MCHESLVHIIEFLPEIYHFLKKEKGKGKGRETVYEMVEGDCLIG